MTTTPGAQPLNAIRQAALDLMRTRKVIAIQIRMHNSQVLILRQDVQESDEHAARVLRALRGDLSLDLLKACKALLENRGLLATADPAIVDARVAIAREEKVR